ncbi:MAG: hypothetical protein ABI571_07135, partial [Actinomycetota bacterium]
MTGPSMVGHPTKTRRAEISGGIMGWLSPLAVGHKDLIAYNAWQDLVNVDPVESLSAQGLNYGDAIGVPELRVINRSDHSDHLVAEGAFSVAWRSDGMFAYFQGSQEAVALGKPFPGQVVVAPDWYSPPKAWTISEDQYVVLAWAEERLLVYRVRDGALDLL